MIVLDWSILISLVITIIYCWKLNSKISELKKGRKELQDLVNSFEQFISKTEKQIKEMKDLSFKASTLINEKFDKAKYLAEDLTFMTERATNLADKLEKMISSTRKINLVTPDIVINESLIEKQFSKKSPTHESKKSTIESLLAKIASVKENVKRDNQDKLKMPTSTEKIFSEEA